MLRIRSFRSSLLVGFDRPARKAVGLAVMLAVGSLAALAETASGPTASFRLTASELEIDEGDVVQFIIEDKTYLDPATGQDLRIEADLSPVEWDFGDGRQDPASAYGLYEIKHWFADDAEAPFTVRASHQGATREINIRVNDVPPVIHSISVTDNPEVDTPVVFQAAVRDPGFDDAISFTWDFGDGATASGPNAIHTWGEAGTYQVTLAVEDEDRNEAPATFTFAVTVGELYGGIAENTFSVSGDFSAQELAFDGLILVGANGSVGNPNAGGDCQIRIEMRSSVEDMGVVLTARLRPGLAPGNYTIGATEEWDGATRQDGAERGTFFAEFYPPADQATRVDRGRRVGGPFWSDRGRLTVTRFEGGVLELYFEAAFTENIPAQFGPRRVAARGALKVGVSSAVSPSDVEGPDDASAIPGLDVLSRSINQWGAGNLRVNSYGCAGEEPEKFELIAARPDANEVSYNYEDSTIELEFSQVVDPDSIVSPETLEDNLVLAMRSSDGTPRRIGGSWMISQQNPKVVQFIPQARLVPGGIHCVYVNGGETGLRSFAGNVLSGSTLEAAAGQMGEACEPAGENRVGHSFATRVELESVGVDLYQASLLGPHAKFSYVAGGWAVARVYPWWQDSFGAMHATAGVREFDARVFAVINREGLAQSEGSDQPANHVEMTIKRPDLYSAEDKRLKRHSIEFTYEPQSRPGGLDYFAVVQPLDKSGAPVDPVDPGVRLQLETSAPLSLSIGVLDVALDCEESATVGLCGSASTSPLGPYVQGDFAAYSLMLPQVKVDLPQYQLVIKVDEACPGGTVNELCFGAGDGSSQPQDFMAVRLQHLAQQIMLDPTIYEAPEPVFAILLGWLPPGWLPDPDAQPVVVYRSDNWDQPVFFVDKDRYDQQATLRRVISELLGDEACRFRGNSICDQTPVQGQLCLPGFVPPRNRHHVEGNEDADRLEPIMRADAEGYTEMELHISAWNFARLYKALERP